MKDLKAHFTDMIDLVEGELAHHDVQCMLGVVRHVEVERANVYREIASDYIIMLADVLEAEGKSVVDAREYAREYAHNAYMQVFSYECDARRCTVSIDGVDVVEVDF